MRQGQVARVCVCMRVVCEMQCAMSVHGHVHRRGRGWGRRAAVAGGGGGLWGAASPGYTPSPWKPQPSEDRLITIAGEPVRQAQGFFPRQPPAVGRESQTERGLCLVAKTGVTPRPLPLKGSGESLAHGGGGAHVRDMVSVSASPGWPRRPEVAPALRVVPRSPREEPGLAP